MVTIDKHVPPPATDSYPFDELCIGDSFFVDDPECKSALVLMSRANKYQAKHFISRTENKGRRFWRTK